MRQFGKDCRFPADRIDHLAARQERRHRIQKGLFSVQDADSHRCHQLVTGKYKEICIQCLHIHRNMRGALCRIDDDDTAFFMHQFRQFLYRISAAKDIGNLRHRCDLCLFCHQGFHILIPVGTIRLTFQINELRACLSGYHLPRQDIAVVVINAD